MLFTDDDQTEPVDGLDSPSDPKLVVNRRLLPGTTIIQTDYNDGSRDFEDAGHVASSTAAEPTSAGPPSTPSPTYSNLINIPQTIDAHDKAVSGQPASKKTSGGPPSLTSGMGDNGALFDPGNPSGWQDLLKSTPSTGQPSTGPVKLSIDASSVLPRPPAMPGLTNPPPGAKPVASPDGYLARTGSQTGRNYANIVQKYAGYIGIDQNSDANKAQDGYHHCARQLKDSQDAVGNAAVWPRVAAASDLGDVLSQAPYNKYWQKVGDGKSIPMSSVPQGAVAVWDNSIGGGAGHVAMVYHKNNRTYLLGDTMGKRVYDITGKSGWNRPIGYYLPR